MADHQEPYLEEFEEMDNPQGEYRAERDDAFKNDTEQELEAQKTSSETPEELEALNQNNNETTLEVDITEQEPQQNTPIDPDEKPEDPDDTPKDPEFTANLDPGARILTNNADDLGHNESKKQDEREKTENHKHLAHSVQELMNDIARIESIRDNYIKRKGEIEEQINQKLNEMKILEITKDIYAQLKETYGSDATYVDIIHAKVANSDQEAIDILQNALSDSDGNLVHLDTKDGRLYHVIDNAETGLPERVYYEDSETIRALLQEGMDASNDKVFANYTSKGLDPTNNQFYEVASINQGHMDGAPEGKILSVNHSFDETFRVCTYNICYAATDIRELQQKLSEIKENIATTDVEIQAKNEALLQVYEKLDQEDALTPGEREAYEQLKAKHQNNDQIADADTSAETSSEEDGLNLNMDENEFVFQSQILSLVEGTTLKCDDALLGFLEKLSPEQRLDIGEFLAQRGIEVEPTPDGEDPFGYPSFADSMDKTADVAAAAPNNNAAPSTQPVQPTPNSAPAPMAPSVPGSFS